MTSSFVPPDPSGTTAFPTLRTPSGELPADAPAWNPQRPGSMPHHRYRPAHDRVALPLADRTWPGRRVERAPLWVPVDLRDGNQALAEPMDTARKRRFFDLLVAMGFKEIEVGYPSASRTDFDFVRHLAESGAVPGDVTISVFTPARTDLIDRTVDSVEGLPRTLIHLYTATAPVWRDVVLGRSRAEVHTLIREAATHLMRRAGERPGADIRFEFSPEVFNLTEPDFVLEICDGLTELWEASPDRPVIHNLPATVEIATPDVYADQIEYMHRHLARRDSVILSVHPHNDRGTGVACAELAVLAGAQRVEGCLFGNGERTGNVDLVTLALNLYAQGVDPMIDFSDIDAVRDVVEHCNRLPVHPRHPYGGDLVHTAFSGTHQDAIAKGMALHTERAAASGVSPGDAPWEVPYLPIDPGDIGRTYEEVIRINSQSGKGGSPTCSAPTTDWTCRARCARTSHGRCSRSRTAPGASSRTRSCGSSSAPPTSPPPTTARSRWIPGRPRKPGPVSTSSSVSCAPAGGAARAGAPATARRPPWRTPCVRPGSRSTCWATPSIPPPPGRAAPPSRTPSAAWTGSPAGAPAGTPRS